MGFRYRLMQFMSGRYGNDSLNLFLTVSAVVLSVLNIFFRSLFVQLLVNLIIVYVIFRMMSRNFDARRRENHWFNDKVNFVKNKKELYERRKNDKSHVYKKCPSCKAILRLPHRIGEHTTVCPRCNKEFKVKVRK